MLKHHSSSTHHLPHGRTRRCASRRHGGVLVYLTVAMVAFTGLAFLGVDIGHAWVVKRQLQMAADAAARYAVMGIGDGTAAAKAISIAGANNVDGTPLVLTNADVTLGTWNSGVFTPGAAGANAVQVSAVRSAARGTRIPTYFGSLLGVTGADISASAIATNLGSGGGFIGLNGVTMSGGSANSYYSSNGSTSYISSSQSSAVVSSNAVIGLSGSAYINGKITLGPAGSYSGAAAQVTGSIKNQGSAFTYANVSAGSYATTNNNGNIPATYIDASRNLSVAGSQSLVLPGGVYYVNNFTTSGGGLINFTGPATIYATGQVDISGSALTTAQNIPDNLKINVTSASNVTISGTGALYGEVYANQSNVTISGSGIVAGSIIGKTINNSGGAALYDDLSATGSVKISMTQ